jgi:hypothetical protein
MTSPRRKKINFGGLLDPNPILKKLKEYDMANKNKPGLKTEAAIKKWLAAESRYGLVEYMPKRGPDRIDLWITVDGKDELIARFSLKDVILKRGPKKKKVKK